MRKSLAVILPAIAVLFTALPAVADLGADLGVSDLIYWDGQGGQVSYGGFTGGIIWRPDHTYSQYNAAIKGWDTWNDPERVFVWVNHVQSAPFGDTDVPAMTLAGVGYDLHEFASFVLAPELGGVLRGDTGNMQLGIMGSIRAYHTEAPVVIRFGGGFVPEHQDEGAGKFLLVKVGVSL